MMTMTQTLILFSVFWYVIVSGLVCWVASEKQRSAVGFFFVSLFCSPLLAILILIALPKKDRSIVPKSMR